MRNLMRVLKSDLKKALSVWGIGVFLVLVAACSGQAQGSGVVIDSTTYQTFERTLDAMSRGLDEGDQAQLKRDVDDIYRLMVASLTIAKEDEPMVMALVVKDLHGMTRAQIADRAEGYRTGKITR